MKKTLLLLIITLSSTFLFSKEQQTNIQPDETLLYATKGNHKLFLDVYEPSYDSERIYNGKEKPTIIYVFGGGFIRGEKNKDYQKKWYSLLTGNGFRVIAIDYRLGLQGKKNLKKNSVKAFEQAIFLAVDDLLSATKYIIDNSESMGIDPDNLVLSGSSSGAITALQAAYEQANRTFHSSLLPSDFKYKGVISFAGALYSKEGKPKYKREVPSTLLLHGTKDRIVTYDKMQVGKKGLFGSNSLEKIFDKQRVNHSIYRYKERGHEIAGAMTETIDQQLYFIYTNIMDGENKIIDAEIADPNITESFSIKNLKDLYK